MANPVTGHYADERFYTLKTKDLLISDTDTAADYEAWVCNEDIQIIKIDILATTAIQGANLVINLNDDYAGGSPTTITSQAIGATAVKQVGVGTAKAFGSALFSSGDTVVCAVGTEDGTGGAGTVTVTYAAYNAG